MVRLSGLKKMVFEGMLCRSSLEALQGEGLDVLGGSACAVVERIEEVGFTPTLVYQAQKMAAVYTMFFCIENGVREFIQERLTERAGPDWWDSCVSPRITKNVESLKSREEKHRYTTPRSTQLIGYTLFGDLADIIISNWEHFSDVLPDQSWLQSRFKDLETLRNTIMHTGTLPEIEIERVESIARDWLRQVG
jgi:hypothetical protein